MNDRMIDNLLAAGLSPNAVAVRVYGVPSQAEIEAIEVRAAYLRAVPVVAPGSAKPDSSGLLPKLAAAERRLDAALARIDTLEALVADLVGIKASGPGARAGLLAAAARPHAAKRRRT